MSSTIAREPSSADWGPPSPLFGEFLDHLRSAGLSEKKISDATGQARHFLVWLQEVGGEIETIDDDVMRHFRDHECRCPRPRFGQYGNHVSRSRSLLSGVRRLVIFLEETGRTRHPGECGEGFRLLDEFLERLSTDRYSRFTIKYYRGICRHFIVCVCRKTPFLEFEPASAVKFDPDLTGGFGVKWTWSATFGGKRRAGGDFHSPYAKGNFTFDRRIEGFRQHPQLDLRRKG